MSNKQLDTPRTTNEMDDETVARWTCLMEAIKMIDAAADRLGIGCESSKWIKPGAIQRYIQEQYPATLESIRYEKQQAIELGFIQPS